MAERPLIVLALILVLFSIIPLNCAAARSSIRLNEQDNGRSLDLSCGSILEISLTGNPTTGYSWEVAAIDPNLIKQIGATEFIPANSLRGSGGTLIMRFQAIHTGNTRLKLIYHRSFEKNVAPLSTFEMILSIK
jgi:inhibitor of cysteine peptidase